MALSMGVRQTRCPFAAAHLKSIASSGPGRPWPALRHGGRRRQQRLGISRRGARRYQNPFARGGICLRRRDLRLRASQKIAVCASRPGRVFAHWLGVGRRLFALRTRGGHVCGASARRYFRRRSVPREYQSRPRPTGPSASSSRSSYPCCRCASKTRPPSQSPSTARECRAQDALGFGLFLIFAGFCVVMAGFTAAFVPETRGVSIDAITQLWSVPSGKGNTLQQPLRS